MSSDAKDEEVRNDNKGDNSMSGNSSQTRKYSINNRYLTFTNKKTVPSTIGWTLTRPVRAVRMAQLLLPTLFHCMTKITQMFEQKSQANPNIPNHRHLLTTFSIS